jgi:hypothetical protein
VPFGKLNFIYPKDAPMKHFFLYLLMMALQACCNLNTQQLGTRDVIASPTQPNVSGCYELPWYHCQRIEVTHEKIVTAY